MVVGISAGAYAASLAGVTALQAASDRQLSDANAPARDAIAAIAAEHDRLDQRLTAAGTAYGSAAAAYADIVDRMTGVETRLGSLARQVKKVEGSAAWVPPAVRLPSVSRAAAAPRSRAGLPTARPARPGTDGPRSPGRRSPDQAPRVCRMSEPTRRLHAFEKRAMGSPLRLSVVGIPAEAAADAWREVSEEIEAAEQAMSRFRDTSDLTLVNRAAGSGSCHSGGSPARASPGGRGPGRPAHRRPVRRPCPG